MKNRNIYLSPEIEEIKLDTNMSLMLQSADDSPDVGPGETYITSDNPAINSHDLIV